jgi:hypothetical protein
MAMDSQEVFNTLTNKVRTPDGTMFVIVLEDKEGKPCGIHINIGKAGSSLSAWANATAALVTRMLGSGIGLNDIIKELSEMTSDKTVLTGDTNVPIRSGPDGLCYALMQYRKEKFREHAAAFEGDSETYRPPQAAI